MRTACPACAATYEVPDRLIGPAGRQLRCAKCGHAWLVQAAGTAGPAAVADPIAAPPLPAPPEAQPTRDLPMPPPMAGLRRSAQLIDPPLPQLDDAPRRPDFLLLAAWVASVLLVVLAGVGLWLFRADLVAAWPPMARLYLALGIGTNGG